MSNTLKELLTEVVDKINASVKTEAQSLSAEAKEVVRNNIGAADLVSLSKKLDKRYIDVETGTWTPIISSGADSTTMAVGSYLKVGDMCVINFTVKGVAPTTQTRLKISGIPFPVAVTEPDELRNGGGTLANYMSPAGDKEPEIYFTGWTLGSSGNILARGCHADGTQNYIDVISKDANALTTFTGSGTILYHTQPARQSKIISVNHRGYNLEAPENTIPAFILSAEKGFTYVECDVAFTKDGVAVLLHDDTIDRTSNGTGAIDDLYYNDLMTLDFGGWFDEKYAGTKIPTFSEFLECCKEYNLHPNIEIKDGAYTERQVQQIVDMVYAHGMIHNSTFISFNSQFLTWVKNYCDVARIGFIEKTPTQSGIDTALSLKTDKNYVYLSTKYTKLTDSIIALCKEKELPIEIWNVNDPEYIKTMDSYITGVTSDSLFIDDILNSKDSTDGEVLYYLPSSAFHKKSILKTTPYQKATANYSVAVKRLTHVTDTLTVTPGDTIRMDIVGTCPLQGAIWTINETGVAAINNGQELTADMYGDTLWQESGYTMTIPEGVVYIWVNLHKTDDTAMKQSDLEYVKIVKV